MWFRGVAVCVFFFFFIPFIHLLSSPFFFSLPPSRNSDPRSHNRLFSPPPHYGSCLQAFIARRFQLFLPSSTRVELCLPTLGTLSSRSFLHNTILYVRTTACISFYFHILNVSYSLVKSAISTYMPSTRPPYTNTCDVVFWCFGVFVPSLVISWHQTKPPCNCQYQVCTDYRWFPFFRDLVGVISRWWLPLRAEILWTIYIHVSV